MKAEQRIVIRTYRRWRRLAGYGLIEHAAYGHTVDVFAADAESDDAAGEHIDEHKDPMAAKQDRLATKQVHAPEAVLGLREEREPGGTRAVGMIGAVVVLRAPGERRPYQAARRMQARSAGQCADSRIWGYDASSR